MPWIDYKQIKISVSFAQVLAYYNISLKPTGENHLTGPCPLPGHAGDRSNQQAFHVDTGKNIFNCFTHCGGGNVIDFVAKMEGTGFREAAIRLHQLFLADTTIPAELNGIVPAPPPDGHAS